MSILKDLYTRTSQLPDVVRGGLWMTATAFLFAATSAIIRMASENVHVLEVVFFRNLFGLMFMLPWLFSVGLKGLRTQRLGTHAMRSIAGLFGMTCWFTSVSLLPIAEATALSFTVPLFATIGAAVFLSETVGIRRWMASLVGFLGVLIIIRPGMEAVTLPALFAIAAAVGFATANLFIKSLSRTEEASAIVFYMGLLMTPVSFFPALYVWETPGLAELGMMALLGLMAMLAHQSMTRSFRAADISAVMPFDFQRLIFAAIIGYVLFAETTDLWTWAGAAVIFSATLYTTHREVKLANAAKAAKAANPAKAAKAANPAKAAKAANPAKAAKAANPVKAAAGDA